jgi:hypothetical protein
MTAILDFGAVGGFIAGSLLVAWALEWFSLLALMSLMPLPVRPAPKAISIAGMPGKPPAKRMRELPPRQ